MIPEALNPVCILYNYVLCITESLSAGGSSYHKWRSWLNKKWSLLRTCAEIFKMVAQNLNIWLHSLTILGQDDNLACLTDRFCCWFAVHVWSIFILEGRWYYRHADTCSTQPSPQIPCGWALMEQRETENSGRTNPNTTVHLSAQRRSTLRLKHYHYRSHVPSHMWINGIYSIQ